MNYFSLCVNALRKKLIEYKITKQNLVSMDAIMKGVRI